MPSCFLRPTRPFGGFLSPRPRKLSFFFVFACAIVTLADAAKPRWTPVDPADLAATECAAAPGTDTEIIFSRHVLSGDSTQNHIRAKIYTRKGVENLSLLSIDHGTGSEISDLAARLVKVNGATVELTKADFHESVRWKQGSSKGKRTSFALPNIEPGDVIEYSWNQEVPLLLFGYHRVFCQAENVFTREYTFEAKSTQMDFNVIWSNCPTAEHDPKSKKVVIRNLPPFVAEPFMPPEADLRGSITIIFTHPLMRFFGLSADWDMLGVVMEMVYRDATEPDKAIRAKATELTADARSPEETVRRLYHFVQSEIKNLDTENVAELAAARKKRARTSEAQKPSKTLERRTGTSWDITLLFASLVRATGLVTHLGMSADREQLLNANMPKGWIFADRRHVVVDYGDRLGFYNPADRRVPFGLLSRKDEGAMIYVCRTSGPNWVTAPVASVDQTLVQRTGRFTLDAEGNLEGTVEVQLTGFQAMDARDIYADKTTDEALNDLRTSLTARLPTAEPTELTWSNIHDNTLPFVLRYKIRVPSYAETTGTRLLFPVNYFTANTPPRFSAETRNFPIFLGTAEKVSDDVEVELPEGYQLDNATTPASIGDIASPVFNTYQIKFSARRRTIIYRRDHLLGNNGFLNLKKESYPALRRVFDQVHRADSHQIVLKPAAPTDT